MTKTDTAIQLPDADLILPAGASREEWLKVRSRGLGASDFSAILEVPLAPGVYGDRYKTWLDKTGQAEPWEPDEDHPAHIGNLMERLLREELSRRVGAEIHTPGLYASRRNPVLRCTPDGIHWDAEREEWVLDEFKNNGGFQGMVLWANGATPLHPLTQVQISMHLTGIRHAVIFALAGGNRFERREVDYSPELGELLEEQGMAFWNDYVLTRRPPEPTALSLDLLQKSFAVSTPKEKAVIDAQLAASLSDEHQTKSAAAKAAEREFKDVNARIKQLAGDAEEIVGPDDELLFTVANDSTLRVKALREERPDMIEKYTVTKPVFDEAAFKAGEPEVYRQFRARSVKYKGE